MRFTDISLATSFRERAFSTTGTSLMIVMMEGYLFVTSRREASKLEKQGYEVFI